MIDVSSIINDPDFNVPFQRKKVLEAIQPDGTSEVVEAPAEDLNGIVLPAKMDDLRVLPEGQRLAGSIAVYSLVELSMGSDNSATTNFQPDLIIYLGNYYRVGAVRYYEQCSLWYVVATRIARYDQQVNNNAPSS